MNSRKKIMVLGLDGCANLGDQAIVDCTTKLIKKSLEELHKETIYDLEIIDFTLGFELGKKRGIQKAKKEVLYALPAAFKESVKEKYIRYKAIKYASSKIDKDVAAVIFAGGGIIKYKYQKFYIFIDAFVKISEKMKIPVMFSGVGIEGYDCKDKRCNLLEKSLNCTCVKTISTRDDIYILKQKYLINNSACQTLRVSDPVCNIAELFGVSKKSKSNVIGLGISRFEIFSDNGVSFERTQVLELWKNLIHYLDSKHLKWKIFTTGLPCDYEAEMELKDYLGNQYPEEYFLPKPNTVNELLEDISNFKVTCVCRLHASIISYSLDIPTMGFVWNDKQMMFAEAIGWKQYFLNREQLKDNITVFNTFNKLNEEDGYKSSLNTYKLSVYNPIKSFVKQI